MYLLSSKHDKDTLQRSFVPIFFSFFHFVKQNISYSPNSVDISTPFAVLTYSPFPETMQYIFDFNPINLLIGIPLNSSFILLITFLLVK